MAVLRSRLRPTAGRRRRLLRSTSVRGVAGCRERRGRRFPARFRPAMSTPPALRVRRGPLSSGEETVRAWQRRVGSKRQRGPFPGRTERRVGLRARGPTVGSVSFEVRKRSAGLGRVDGPSAAVSARPLRGRADPPPKGRADRPRGPHRAGAAATWPGRRGSRCRVRDDARPERRRPGACRLPVHLCPCRARSVTEPRATRPRRWRRGSGRTEGETSRAGAPRPFGRLAWRLHLRPWASVWRAGSFSSRPGSSLRPSVADGPTDRVDSIGRSGKVEAGSRQGRER